MGLAIPKHETPDALLAIAYQDGRRIGLLGLPSELVPGQSGTPARLEAFKGWQSGNAIYSRYQPRDCAINTQPAPEHTLA